MKQVNQELLDYLHNRTEFFMCDLYEITLSSGLTFRYADYDMDITLPDGRVFSCKGPGFKRSRIKLSSGISVDELSVTVLAEITDEIAGAPVMHVAHNGGFDNATLGLWRCFMSAPGIVVGVLEMFTGDINVDEGGGLSMTWKVKSMTQRLNVKYPLRNYYPGCPYSLYDAGCGVSLTAFTATGTVTVAANSQVFYSDLRFADGYYDQGGVEFITGNLAGVAAPVKFSRGDTGEFTLLIPLSTAPVAGDIFRVFPGCDKQPETCRDKFNNFAHNRATPYIPLPEAII